MHQTRIKYCRNCDWAKRGWCEFLQQELKPVAGGCFAFISKSRKKRIQESCKENFKNGKNIPF